MSRPFVVRATSRSFGRHTRAGVRLLEDAGYDVILAGPGGPWPEEQMREYARDADALIVGADQVTRNVLTSSRRLRVVAKHGVGVDNIDLAAAEGLGIRVTYAPGGNTRSVAEMTVAMLLSLWRGLARADARLRARVWEPMVGREAAGRTLGIIGLGRIGRAVAILAQALGMRILACDIVQDPAFAERGSPGDTRPPSKVEKETPFVPLNRTRQVCGEPRGVPQELRDSRVRPGRLRDPRPGE